MGCLCALLQGPGDEGLGAQRCAIVDVIDIEESIWSPRFGLKVLVGLCHESGVLIRLVLRPKMHSVQKRRPSLPVLFLVATQRSIRYPFTELPP
mmetsp:Transcript_39016/g.110500  ORF Transcript_39016/g.110500 Transcript_39016/m.110500 type:complete len:94 (+) Transcript_39016:126-407(+)